MEGGVTEANRILQDKASGQWCHLLLDQIKQGPKRVSTLYKHFCAFPQTTPQPETM